MAARKECFCGSLVWKDGTGCCSLLIAHLDSEHEGRRGSAGNGAPINYSTTSETVGL